MKKNKTFCSLLWTHLHADTHGNVPLCCISNHQQDDMFLGNLKTHTIEEVRNSDTAKEIRRKMRVGEHIPQCEICYKNEASGVKSMRQYENEKWGDMFHPKTGPIEVQSDGSVTNPPVYFDIRFSNICNLKCRTCWHGSSSSWFKDAKKLDRQQSDSPIIQFDEGEFTLDQIMEFLPYAKEMYFAGGEPLLMKENYLILEELIRVGNTDCTLRYNTNFTELKGVPGQRNILDLWKEFKYVCVSASVDGTDKTNYTIRGGSDLDRIKQNRRKQAEVCPHVHFQLAVTVSLLNIMDIEDIFMEWFGGDLLQFDTPGPRVFFNILHVPEFYSIRNLKPHVCEKVLRTLKGLKSTFERLHHNNVENSYPQALEMDKLINYIETHYNEYSEDLTQQLLGELYTLDELRDENLLEYMKERLEI